MIDRTFRAGEKFRPVRTEVRKMQFLYAEDGTDAHFMDSSSYEQMEIPGVHARRRAALDAPEPTRSRCSSSMSSQPTCSCRARSTSRSRETEPGVRGDTASGGGTKPAVLETGAQIQVPLFVNIGDRVRVDTRTGDYVSRA